MTESLIIRYLFKDEQTNEVFPVESSFCIWSQALEASPQYQLARIAFAFGGGKFADRRFKCIHDPTRDQAIREERHEV